MDALGGHERTFSPVEVCERFQIPRTTLFRWERDGEIPKVERSPRGERIYRQQHLERIEQILRAKAEQELELARRHNAEGGFPSYEFQERLYRSEVFSSETPEDEIANILQLQGLAMVYPLGADTLRLLVNEALARPLGDIMRTMVWKLLLIHDEHAPRQGSTI